LRSAGLLSGAAYAAANAEELGDIKRFRRELGLRPDLHKRNCPNGVRVDLKTTDPGQDIELPSFKKSKVAAMQHYGRHAELSQNPPSRYVDGMVMRSKCFFEILFTNRPRTKMVFECLGSDGTFEADTVYYGGKRQGWVNCAVSGTFKRERDLHCDPLIDLSALSL